MKNDGKSTLLFPASVTGGSYYIVIKHRNSIETWSSLPVLFTSNTNYNFTSGLTKAYNDGVNPPMKNMGDGNYAIYSGDINNDGGIDIFDMQVVENEAASFSFGYNASDCNGDGGTDIFDLQILENNSETFIYISRPF